MTDEIDPAYASHCKICGVPFEMIWGEENDFCAVCKERDKPALQDLPHSRMPMPFDGPGALTNMLDTSGVGQKISIDILELNRLIDIADYYANEANWQKEKRQTTAGSETIFIGDGGEYARKTLE